MGGWREVRLSIFAKRPRGEPVTDLDAWDRARLPRPTARVATAAIRTSAAPGPQWRRAAARLGIKRSAELTVLADGARWIWAELEKNLPGAAGVLDIFHASEHLHAAALARGGGAAAVDAWYRARRRTLLESGAAGLLEELAARGEEAPALAEYLGPHAGHTPYRGGWPRAGRSAAGWSRGRARRRSAAASSRPGRGGGCGDSSGWRRCAACSTATCSTSTGSRPPHSDQIPLPQPGGRRRSRACGSGRGMMIRCSCVTIAVTPPSGVRVR